MRRRVFINRVSMAGMAMCLPPVSGKTSGDKELMTVGGWIDGADAGFTLTHEHLLVDFIGAAGYDPARWNDQQVYDRVTPFLTEIKSMGCRTFADCTPEFIGRDPVLLKRLSEITGMNILTNTGLYGAADNKYIPGYAYKESAGELSERWVREFEEGIGDTGIRPGFMKIGVAPESLSSLHRKLVTAAALAHLKTGMTIASHTGPAVAAFDELEVLEKEGVHPGAFIWVHAQNEKNEENRFIAARKGAWVSLDGLGPENVDQYVEWLEGFKEQELLGKVLISHDAGWYSPGETDGGDFRPFTTVFTGLIPALKKAGFSRSEIDRIFEMNPRSAFGIKVRNL